MLTFTDWKDLQVKKDSVKHKVDLYFRSREWYWKAYGKYCNKYRKQKVA